jgi:hypothetical protein
MLASRVMISNNRPHIPRQLSLAPNCPMPYPTSANSSQLMDTHHSPLLSPTHDILKNPTSDLEIDPHHSALALPWNKRESHGRPPPPSSSVTSWQPTWGTGGPLFALPLTHTRHHIVPHGNTTTSNPPGGPRQLEIDRGIPPDLFVPQQASAKDSRASNGIPSKRKKVQQTTSKQRKSR